ncbi:MAG: SUMF1/EgtB/PvdO family nonheme iron enzyme, partial [Mycobacteriales bacterium]
MAWVPGGAFAMGSDPRESGLADYPEEGPPHEAAVDGFWMDRTPVTVADFRRFVSATGYVTVAGRALDPAAYPRLDPALLVPGSLVFSPTRGPVDRTDMRQWWRYVPGADWAHPEGPGSRAGGRDRHPVTHVCWPDVVAYADWAGRSLPTEAEWERAARGGLDGALFAWGEQEMPKGRPMANTWIGDFPWRRGKPAGRQRTSPVRSFPPNGFGLYDVTGNVWEWTSDFYRARHEAAHPCCAPANPRVLSPKGSYDAAEPGG